MNSIVTNSFSNPTSDELYKNRWPNEPQCKKQYKSEEYCICCAFYAEFCRKWGLCCHTESRHYLETIREKFTCPSFVAKYLKDMEWIRKTEPIPHTEYRVRPDVQEEVWDKLVNFLAWHYPHNQNWVFRGHRRESDELTSTIDRQLKKRKKYISQEKAANYLLKQFKRAAHHFLNCSMVPNNDKNNILEWLSLMRHYGAPTRLLDFTHSPYIACHFALEVYNKDNTNHAIWAINTESLIKKVFHALKRIFQA